MIRSNICVEFSAGVSGTESGVGVRDTNPAGAKVKGWLDYVR
jgi:hypothetical protein